MQCPKCDSAISNNAVTCPYCKSDIAPKTPLQRRTGAFVKGAAVFRDWIGVPVTLATLITAFYYPAVGAVRGWLGTDRASLSLQLLNPDLQNVGLDDKPPGSRVDEVSEYENLLRGQLLNSGYALASVASHFTCTGPLLPDQKRMVYLYNFYDVQRGVKIFPEVGPRTAISFFARNTYARAHDEKDLPAAGPSKCEVIYFDKHTRNKVGRATLDIADRDDLLQDIGKTNKKEQWLTTFCQGDRVSGMTLNEKVKADCISATHVMALESADRLTLAITRALSAARAFAELTGGKTEKTPGIVLVCDQDETTCMEERERSFKEVGLIGVALRAWHCHAVGTRLGCEFRTFPRSPQQSPQSAPPPSTPSEPK